MKVLLVFVISTLALSAAARPRREQPKLMVYEIRERDDGNGPDVQMLKVPGDVLYKTISSLTEPAEEDEDSDRGVDVQKLLSSLMSNKNRVNKKKEKQRNMLQTLKNLVKRLEREYELDDSNNQNDRDRDDDESNLYLLSQALQKSQSKADKQENPLLSLPLQLALRSRPDDDDREERSYGDDRTMPPPPSGKYADDQ